MTCRHCRTELELPFVDLDSAPPSNAYLTEQTLKRPEKWFPLRVLVCERCWLVQTEDFAQTQELFDADYAYFERFLKQLARALRTLCRRYVGTFRLNTDSHVVEVAANDGYLLQYVKARGIACTGVEPTASTAAAARARGIPIVEDFFGVRLARRLAAEGKHADLTVAFNVLAHVPDINDFVAGFPVLLKPQGVATFEFPHLLKLIAENQFDTIYHEHFSYLSLTAVVRIFAANGLAVFDVEEQPTHGGSLRVFAQRSDTGQRLRGARVDEVLDREERVGMTSAQYYAGFQARTDNVKNAFLGFLLDARRGGKSVAAYGAAAKGNTLMNYAGVRPDLISFVVDRSPAKQGKYMPGSRIPIADEARLKICRPDYIVILPWNLRAEVMRQVDYVSAWGGTFVSAVPELAFM